MEPHNIWVRMTGHQLGRPHFQTHPAVHFLLSWDSKKWGALQIQASNLWGRNTCGASAASSASFCFLRLRTSLRLDNVMLIHDLQPPQFTKRGEYQFSKQFNRYFWGNQKIMRVYKKKSPDIFQGWRLWLLGTRSHRRLFWHVPLDKAKQRIGQIGWFHPKHQPTPYGFDPFFRVISTISWRTLYWLVVWIPLNITINGKINLVGGAMCPSWKMMEFVNGKDFISFIMEKWNNKIHVPKHQPGNITDSAILSR